MSGSPSWCVDVFEVLTSWTAVYICITLPGVLLLLNFVFGNCFVSEALTAHQHGGDSTHSFPRVVGRGCVVLVSLSFAWQYHAYMFASRSDGTGGDRPLAACNPLYAVWQLVDSLPYVHRFRPVFLLDCTWGEAAYLGMFGSFLFLYVGCVFSAPQSAPATAACRSSTGYCHRCQATVRGRDHHCYLIGNCVGASNYTRFVACLVSGVANLTVLLYQRGAWAFHSQRLTNLVGLLLVCGFVSGLGALLVFHGLLLRRGLTTWQFLKEKRQNGQGWMRCLYKLAVGHGVRPHAEGH